MISLLVSVQELQLYPSIGQFFNQLGTQKGVNSGDLIVISLVSKGHGRLAINRLILALRALGENVSAFSPSFSLGRLSLQGSPTIQRDHWPTTGSAGSILVRLLREQIVLKNVVLDAAARAADPASFRSRNACHLRFPMTNERGCQPCSEPLRSKGIAGPVLNRWKRGSSSRADPRFARLSAGPRRRMRRSRSRSTSPAQPPRPATTSMSPRSTSS